MTPAEIQNDGNITTIKDALKGLSRDLGVITPEQKIDLSFIQYELIDLMSDIMGSTRKES